MSVDFHLGEGDSRSAILWTVEHADGVEVVKERNTPQYWEHSTRHITTWPQTSYIWNRYANSGTGKKKWRVIMRGFICLTMDYVEHNINDHQAAQFLRIQEPFLFKKCLTFHTPTIL
jgi:hypothetical protein